MHLSASYSRHKLFLTRYLIIKRCDLILIGRENDQNQNELKAAAKSSGTFSGSLTFVHCDVYVKARGAQIKIFNGITKDFKTHLPLARLPRLLGDLA